MGTKSTKKGTKDKKCHLNGLLYNQKGPKSWEKSKTLFSWLLKHPKFADSFSYSYNFNVYSSWQIYIFNLNCSYKVSKFARNGEIAYYYSDFK